MKEETMNTPSGCPIRIGFGSLKGGTGKSTLAEITASYLCFTEGLRLFVVDCDYSQYSFFGLRERDKQTVQNGEPALQARMKKHFEALGREAYRVIKSTAARAEEDVRRFIAERTGETFDLILFDLPGRADDPGLVELTLGMDYLISPIEPDRQSLVASMTYAPAIRDLGVSDDRCRIKEIYLVWNKIDRRVRTDVIAFYNEAIKREGLGLFDTQLPRSARFKKELTADGRPAFRSTYLPPDKSLIEGSGIESFVKELIEKCNLKTARP